MTKKFYMLAAMGAVSLAATTVLVGCMRTAYEPVYVTQPGYRTVTYTQVTPPSSANNGLVGGTYRASSPLPAGVEILPSETDAGAQGPAEGVQIPPPAPPLPGDQPAAPEVVDTQPVAPAAPLLPPATDTAPPSGGETVADNEPIYYSTPDVTQVSPVTYDSGWCFAPGTISFVPICQPVPLFMPTYPSIVFIERPFCPPVYRFFWHRDRWDRDHDRGHGWDRDGDRDHERGHGREPWAGRPGFFGRPTPVTAAPAITGAPKHYGLALPATKGQPAGKFAASPTSPWKPIARTTNGPGGAPPGTAGSPSFGRGNGPAVGSHAGGPGMMGTHVTDLPKGGAPKSLAPRVGFTPTPAPPVTPPKTTVREGRDVSPPRALVPTVPPRTNVVPRLDTLQVDPPRPSAPGRVEAPPKMTVPPAVESHRVDAPKIDVPKFDAPRPMVERRDSPKVESAKGAPSRVDPPRVVAPKIEAPRVDPPRADAPHVVAPRIEAPRVDPPRVEAPHVVAPRIEAPRVDPPRVVAPRVEAPRVDPPRVERSSPPPASPPPPSSPPSGSSSGGSSSGGGGSSGRGGRH